MQNPHGWLGSDRLRGVSDYAGCEILRKQRNVSCRVLISNHTKNEVLMTLLKKTDPGRILPFCTSNLSKLIYTYILFNCLGSAGSLGKYSGARLTLTRYEILTTRGVAQGDFGECDFSISIMNTHGT